MQFVMYCAYRGKLETAFLAAELASAAAADTRKQEMPRTLEDFASPFGSPSTQGGNPKILCHDDVFSTSAYYRTGHTFGLETATYLFFFW